LTYTPLAPSNGRARAKWRDDEDFCEAAQAFWPEDYRRAQNPGYDRGATQNLSHRYQGWSAAILARKSLKET
jgi:hypothetical protein